MGPVGTRGGRFAGAIFVTLAGIVGMCAIVFGSVCLWAAVKFLAVEFDREDYWDLADFGAAALVGVGTFSLQLALRDFQAGVGSGLPYWSFALREATMLAYAMAIAFWMASAWIESDLDVALPDDLEPMAERVWSIHLGWVPFIGGRADGE